MIPTVLHHIAISFLHRCSPAYSWYLPCFAPLLQRQPNARHELLPEAGAQRTLEAVSSMPLFGAVQLMRKAMWKVLRGMAAPWDILLPPLCADDRDDFCDHLLQFL